MAREVLLPRDTTVSSISRYATPMPEPTRLRPTDRHVLTVLRQKGELDRTVLASLSGVPRSTLNDVVLRLQRAGLVVEQTAVTGHKPGRPARRIALASATAPVGVIAMTHDAVQVAVVTADGEPQAVRREECRFATDGEEMLERGLGLLSASLAALGNPALGAAVVGVPVPFESGRGAVWAGDASATFSGPGPLHPRAPSWLQSDPSAAISERLGVPARTENDANLGALGEAAHGAAQGMQSFLYLKIVHGVGAALFLNGKLHRGASGLAGELGHLHVYEEGPVCTCGGRGCLITMLDTPRLVDLIQPSHETPLTMKDVLRLSSQGDAGVNRVLGDLGRTLGRSLADMCVYLNPDGIVVDGLLDTASAPVIAGIRSMIDRYAHPRAANDVRIVTGALPHDAELRGAAALMRSFPDSAVQQ